MNPEVVKMQAFNPGGNIIPHAWYKNIRKETGKPDLLALCILADICYWYRPTVVKDEKTGEVIGLKQKFKKDLLQKSYKSYAELFGMSKRKVKSSFDLLESLGFIKRDFRNIDTDLGRLTNVMFISINPEKIQEASTIATTATTSSTKKQELYHLPTKNDPTPLKKTTPGRGKKRGDLLYTENTTEITSENKQKKKKTFLPPDFIISDRVKKWAEKKGYKNLEEHLEAFKLTCTAKGYKYLDWDSAFMNAIRNNWARIGDKADDKYKEYGL